MKYLYHGSSIPNIKELEPRLSTHGSYVYATEDSNIATLFAKRCGDDLVYSLYCHNMHEPWNLVERVPKAIETMMKNKGYIYCVDATDFKNMNTSFCELMCDHKVTVEKVVTIDNVLEAVKKIRRTRLFKNVLLSKSSL